MQTRFALPAATLAIMTLQPAHANEEINVLKREIEKNNAYYEQRIKALEQQLSEKSAAKRDSANSFNPAISVILDGRYADFSNEVEDYELPGFMLGGEAGLGEDGFSVGHTEVAVSANIDDKFYGKMTAALADHEGETEVELEEAYIQTLGLGGATVKAGRFYSAVGYLNEQHQHMWDFADAPLIYRGLFGDQLLDDGLQLTYVAPTELLVQFGAEALSGRRFPAGGEGDGIGAWSAFFNLGGDIGDSHSWQIGLNYWQADDIDGRTGGGHGHGDEEAEIETPSFIGESTINAVDLVYKWAPNGNPVNRHFKFQAEYFQRDEDGVIDMIGSDPFETTTYDGDQSGWYTQLVYQFIPRWRAGLRYDRLNSDNSGDPDILAEAGLDNEGHTPERTSVMLEWLPSEFSRIRLQYNRDESYAVSDDQVFVQYTHSLGSHGAHQF